MNRRRHQYNQIAAFARPQHNRFEIGFRVKLRDEQERPTPADKKFIKLENARCQPCRDRMPWVEHRVPDGAQKEIF